MYSIFWIVAVQDFILVGPRDFICLADDDVLIFERRREEVETVRVLWRSLTGSLVVAHQDLVPVTNETVRLRRDDLFAI